MKKNDRKIALSAQGLQDSIETLKAHFWEDGSAIPDQVPWLKMALGQDEDLLVCQHRRIYSEVFLQTVLYPAVDQHVEINENTLADFLATFRRTLSGPGDDFEASNVIGSILNRFSCYSADGLGNAPGKSVALDRDMQIFLLLSELELDKVELLVSKKLLK